MLHEFIALNREEIIRCCRGQRGWMPKLFAASLARSGSSSLLRSLPLHSKRRRFQYSGPASEPTGRPR